MTDLMSAIGIGIALSFCITGFVWLCIQIDRRGRGKSSIFDNEKDRHDRR
jgi:hypothetical protein